MSDEIVHNGVTAPIKVGDTIGLFPVTNMSEKWDSTEEGAEAVTTTHADEKYAYFSSETTGDTGKFAWTLRSACLNSGYPSSTTRTITSTTITNCLAVACKRR